MTTRSLFAKPGEEPLASRVRPQTLAEFVGQTHLLGQDKLLKELIDQDHISSMIFWGPPGTGKTTLAQIIARKTQATFLSFSAVDTGISQIKKIMQQAVADQALGAKTIVFVDEIHRFNKAQQDAFLPYIEDGSIVLIGATTENPSFEVNAALLSRCKVFVLHPLSTSDIVALLHQALQHPKGFGSKKIDISAAELTAIANYADGDARTALNILEMAVINGQPDKETGMITVDTKDLEAVISNKFVLYDKKGEEHYNLISALHKSMRNSDPDAAIYWLSRMLAGGEDPLYIARRLIRFASEDVGLADPNALNLTINVYQACQFLGLPECDVHLVEAVTYLSLAPKSNALYQARLAAQRDVKKTANEPVPLHLRNAPTRLMKDLGYGQGYVLAHNEKDKLTTMETMPPALADHHYYQPTSEGKEIRFKNRLAQINQWQATHRNPTQGDAHE